MSKTRSSFAKVQGASRLFTCCSVPSFLLFHSSLFLNFEYHVGTLENLIKLKFEN